MVREKNSDVEGERKISRGTMMSDGSTILVHWGAGRSVSFEYFVLLTNIFIFSHIVKFSLVNINNLG